MWFRSRGGPDETWNRIGLCAAHHLRGIHRGWLKVKGRAGERLVWTFGTGEIWVTEGADDVRREAPEGVRETAPAYALRHAG